MRGSIRRRYQGSWTLILDLGRQLDPTTGGTRRQQKWITFRGTKKQAEAKLNDLVRAADRGEFVEPTKQTFGEWLIDWLDKAIKPPQRSRGTYDSYKRIIESHIVPALGSVRLQGLRSLDLEAYYAARTSLAPASLQIHHAIIHGALSAALRSGLVYRNVAALATNKPRAPKGRQDVLTHVWTAEEAKRFLTAAKAAGAQPAAFYALALDSGARKSEIAALRWTDVDLQTGGLTIARQLVVNGREPEFGPTKTQVPRTLDLSAETIALLRTHKAHQAEIKLRNRTFYKDLGLIFAREWADLRSRTDSLGLPLRVNNIGAREFDRLIKAANVPRIKFHGLRHTCATLMLSAGVPPHVVQRRLGHTKVTMTLDIYGHVLPSMQQDAASRLAVLLHG